MAIEFNCVQCQKLLRTGDDTAGKQAKCPECGTVMTIPAAPAAGMDLPPSPLPSAGGDPFGSASPFAGGGSGQASFVPPFAAKPASAAAARAAGPAIALIVTAILGICFDILGVIGNLIMMAGGGAMRPPRPNEIPAAFQGGIGVAAGIVALVLGVVILLGALKMKRLESYPFAMTAAIVAMVPCFWPCCLLGLPFGIWALVVLSDSSVKAAFRG